MPIPHSPEYRETVQGPYTVKNRVDVEVLGAVVDHLYPSEGSVRVDAQQSIRRTCSFKIVDEERKYTPQGAADMFNPISGVILRPYSGAEIPSVKRVSMIMDTEEQWDTGTFTDVISNSDGSISIP